MSPSTPLLTASPKSTSSSVSLRERGQDIAFSSPVYVNPPRSFQEQVKPTNVNQDFKQFINARMDHLKPKRGEASADQPAVASGDKDDPDKNSMSNIIKRNRANRFGNGGRFQYQPRAQPKVSSLLLFFGDTWRSHKSPYVALEPSVDHNLRIVIRTR